VGFGNHHLNRTKHTNLFIISEHNSVGDIMVEGYSELLVKFNCEYDKEQETEIRNAWQSLLEKYKKCGIQDDEIGEMFQEDGIHFGIGAKGSKSDEPEYEARYQMFGEFVRAIQEILADWELDIHIQKTGASPVG
jgi:hypothetical protein